MHDLKGVESKVYFANKFPQVNHFLETTGCLELLFLQLLAGLPVFIGASHHSGSLLKMGFNFPQLQLGTY